MAKRVNHRRRRRDDALPTKRECLTYFRYAVKMYDAGRLLPSRLAPVAALKRFMEEVRGCLAAPPDRERLLDTMLILSWIVEASNAVLLARQRRRGFRLIRSSGAAAAPPAASPSAHG